MQKAHSGYRPALDGLRAIAVVAVIVYHLNASWLRGGFLGVDLFFVLSGYLITGLLVDEHARTGGINLPGFWARRARRLAPALLLMVAAVAIAVRMWAPITDWSQRRNDLLSTVFYYANWHMISSDQSYFAEFTAQSPVRHVWSLAIEEQFYIVWPLLVLALLRWRRRWMPAVFAAGAAASACAMVLLYTPLNPTRAYAGTDTRAQQLLIGALLALAVRRIGADSGAARGTFRRVPYLVGPLAALTTALALATIRDTGGFYYHGGATVIAVVMVVLIWAVERAPDSPLARALSIGPVRWLGQISYGLYLWHWPVIRFTEDLPPALARARLPLILALAVVSYYLVERPIRRGRPRIAVGTPLRLAATASVALVLTATGAVAAANLAGGVQKEQLLAMKGALCKGAPMCWRVPAPPGRPVIAVVGDSTAMALDPGFVDLAHRRGWGYVLAARQGCGVTGLPFTLRYPAPPYPLQVQCAKDQDDRLRRVLDTYHPWMVFALSAFEAFPYVARDGAMVAQLTPQWTDGLYDALRRVAVQVTRSGAVFVTPGVLPRVFISQACVSPRPAQKQCRAGTSNPTAAENAANGIYRRVVNEVPGTHVVAMQRYLCPRGGCPMVIDGQVVRYDGIHFTPDGARWFVSRMSPLLPDPRPV